MTKRSFMRRWRAIASSMRDSVMSPALGGADHGFDRLPLLVGGRVAEQADVAAGLDRRDRGLRQRRLRADRLHAQVIADHDAA